ncbi:MAG: F0F1 ATP synthase subunit delta, partial [Bacteroidaceae bacterium]
MDAGIISMRYAKALIEYAKEQGMEDKVYKEMRTLSQNFASIPTLRSTLDNPVLSCKEKLSLACNAAGGEVSKELARFI